MFKPTKYNKNPMSMRSFMLAIVVAVLFIVFAFTSRTSNPHGTMNEYPPVQQQQHARAPVVGSVAGKGNFRTCTSGEATRQGSLLKAAKIRGCPPDDDIWLRTVQLLMPQASVFVDIGSNKGYSGARFFSLWSPELGVNPQSLRKALLATTKRKDLLECGACSDCNESTRSLNGFGERMCGPKSGYTSNPNAKRSLARAVDQICNERVAHLRPIRVYSYDGNKGLVDGVSAAISTLQPRYATGEFDEKYIPAAQSIAPHWSVEHGAFTEEYVPGKFIVFSMNGELGHIVSDTQKQKAEADTSVERVPVLTVDHIVERDNLQHIDFLKIDTEGHDPGVLAGAAKTFKEGKVTVVMFEYNNVWPDKIDGEPALKNVVDKLAVNGYVCFIEGKNALVRLTTCWSHELEEQMWSNVWCANSKNTLGSLVVSVFDSYSIAFSH